MVQPNPEARPRRSRPRRSEEQAPLVESRLSITSDVIMDGEPWFLGLATVLASVSGVRSHNREKVMGLRKQDQC